MTTETIAAPAVERPARRLGSAPFVLLATAQTSAMAAEFFSYIALSWLTLQLTGSGVALGAVLATQAVPRAVLMLLGGAFSDRFTAFRVMIATATVRAVLVGGVALLVATGDVQAWQLFVVAGALGALGAFFTPASSAALPAVVDAELLEGANAWLSIASQVAIVGGPALAGLVVARWGSGPAFALDAAGFALTALACLPLRGLIAAAGGQQAGILSAIRKGLVYMWSSPMLRSLLGVVLVLNFASAGPFEVGATVLARHRWGGAIALGIVIGAVGLGMLVGALGSGMLRGRVPLGWAIVAVALSFGVIFPLIGLAPTVWVAAALTAVLGAFNGVVKILGFSWIQRGTPPELLGRVMSLVMAAAIGVAPLSFAIAGLLVNLSPEVLFATGGAACLLVGAASVASRTVRETA